MSQSPFFWNMLAKRYSRMKIPDEAAYREKLSRTQAILQPDWEVLEFGCGTGSTALEHAPHVAHIRGIDYAPRMIDICRDKAANADVENATFDVAEIGSLEAADDSFDAVLGMSILHLLDNRDAVVAKIFSMLRPGGAFISSTICLEGQAPFLVKYILPVGSAVGLLPRLQCFSLDDLLGALEGAGFEIEQRWQPDGAGMKAVFIVARKPAKPALV